MSYLEKTSSSMSHSLGVSDKLARGIGWFSVGVGLFELLAPRKLTNALGMEGKETLVRACGMRQIISGIGALSDNPTPALWSRVGGDVLDLASLTPGLRDGNPQKHNVERAMTFVAVTCAVDLYCAQALHKRHKYPATMIYDYSDRSGFSRPVADVRGAASAFEVPVDMRAFPPMWAEFKSEENRRIDSATADEAGESEESRLQGDDAAFRHKPPSSGHAQQYRH